MKSLKLISMGVITALVTILVSANANAGQITATGASITWDDSSLYAPVACSKFNFDIVIDKSIWQVSLSIKNKFGDIVAGSSSTYGNGQISLQVCTGKDLTGTVLVAEIVDQKVVTTIYEKPITFLSRTALPTPTPVPSVKTTPTPVPTVTITATPVPAPTVTVTAQPVQSPTDWAALESLKAELAITKNDLKTLKSKLMKICSTKPKPKGC